MPMDDGDVQRVLGKLEEGFRSINETQRRLSENQGLLSQTIATLSEKTQDCQIKHATADARFQGEIFTRITSVEDLVVIVEGHGDALVDHEKRINTQEENENIRIKIKKRDIHWMQIVTILVFILVGDKFTGNKLSEWVSLLFK